MCLPQHDVCAHIYIYIYIYIYKYLTSTGICSLYIHTFMSFLIYKHTCVWASTYLWAFAYTARNASLSALHSSNCFWKRGCAAYKTKGPDLPGPLIAGFPKLRMCVCMYVWHAAGPISARDFWNCAWVCVCVCMASCWAYLSAGNRVLCYAYTRMCALVRKKTGMVGTTLSWTAWTYYMYVCVCSQKRTLVYVSCMHACIDVCIDAQRMLEVNAYACLYVCVDSKNW
jgi:hypothetical protein